MHDGSPRFGELPQSVLWYDLRDYIEGLDGADLTEFVTDGITEAWIEFKYRGYQFSVNDQFGEYWFFVDDPHCPDDVLEEVLAYCGRVLSESE